MMVRTLTAVLLAATAMVPSIAAAQDGRAERWGDRREAGREQQDDRGQARDDRRGDRGDRGANRGDTRVEPRAVPQARPGVRQDARPDARPDDRARSGRDGRYQDNRPALIERQRMIEAQRRERVVPAPQPGRVLRNDRRDDTRRDDTRRNDQRNWRDNDRRAGDNQWRDSNRRGDNDDRWRGNRRADNDRWDRNWRSDRRYGWQDYRSSNRHVYRVPRYYGPRGYSYNYRRWSPGYQIQSYFYDQRYWITDPSYYRLPDVWGPYRWVRYYDDVLLIDVRNGMIVDTIYDFFWR